LADLEQAVREVVGGDAAAFQRIVEATAPRLVRLAARILGDVSEAEDVVQDSYVKTYQALTSQTTVAFDGRSSIETWLYRVVVNASVDERRRRGRRPMPTDTIGEISWDGRPAAEARIALAELSDWLQDLPAEQHTAIVLKCVEGLSSAEVAKTLRCSEGAVEQRLVRARAALRRRSALSGVGTPGDRDGDSGEVKGE
jgi:RNA polymerase sigma-70 factor, ECF subfamily